jgi:hypothetical protein
VFLIIAVGWKCMYLCGTPSALQGQQQLFIRASHNANTWFIDARIKAIQMAPWVNAVSGEISPAHSMELDCWTTVWVAGQIVLQNWRSLVLIEQFLVGIQSTLAL